MGAEILERLYADGLEHGRDLGFGRADVATYKGVERRRELARYREPTTAHRDTDDRKSLLTHWYESSY